MINTPDPSGLPPLAAGVLARERRALAQAITLCESGRADHRAQADALLAALLPHSGGALRVGISGAPGVGKSSFIEALGMQLLERGERVAVLAVDPSSTVNGGSILGDKTRMETLARQAGAFIRPSPSRGALGGVGQQTREALMLCEAAGFSVIIVETVGVGQSETAVAGMSDVFLLLQSPFGGDELQGIKKGILELADLVVFNKADLNPQATALACSQMRSALGMVRAHSPHWSVPVLPASALTGEGMAAVWDAVLAQRKAMQEAGQFEQRRSEQALAWTSELIAAGLRRRFDANEGVRQALAPTLAAVAEGRMTPVAAAALLLDQFAKPA
ncbi:methylmalonyl Co-A mutase-associated GTPase MeaB [Pseudoduganella rhizocola]|uniref:methylmalonyl Co-A mutase-associated GTPase MeaB n=1 Tax=Pseudoduganella rhizocola TaxID=3382643 RepID=UPI0038B4A75A